MGQSKSHTRAQRGKSTDAAAAGVNPSTGGTSGAARSSVWTFGCVLVVVFVTWSVFQPALHGGWLEWDDDKLLLAREEWRGLAASNLSWMFTTFHMGPYQPLSWLSYAIDHAVGGLDARVYHRTNVLLHCASAVCSFFVARALFEAVRTARARHLGAALADLAERAPNRLPSKVDLAALLATLFWAVHPLRVESVAWITERRDCLSGLFFLLAMWAWTEHVRRGAARGRWYWLAVAAFAASLLSKGLGLMFPHVLVCLDVWPFERFVTVDSQGIRSNRIAQLQASLREKLPLFALSCAAGIVAVVGQRAAGALVESSAHGPIARVVQAAYGLAFYVRKTVWPDDLMVLYPMTTPLPVGEPRFVVSIVAVIGLGVVLYLFRRRAPALALACVSYAILVAPVLGLVQTGSHLVADRYGYLATLPLCLCVGGAVLAIRARTAWVSGAVLCAGAVALVPLSRATERQIPVWRDTLSLWLHDLAIDPTDRPASRSLMVAYEKAGRAARTPNERARNFENALAVARAGLALAPDAGLCAQAAKIHGQLAADEPEKRAVHLQAALEYALRSVEIVERTGQRLPAAYESAGVILAELGRVAEALPYLAKLATLEPDDASRAALLGEVLLQLGRADEALHAFENARRLDPNSTWVLLDLGDAYRLLGDRGRAAEAYQRVVELKRSRLGAAAETDPEVTAARRALTELN